MDKIGDGMSKVKRWKHNTEQCYLMTQYFKFKKTLFPQRHKKKRYQVLYLKKLNVQAVTQKLLLSQK